jgi:hypothetical protein
LLRWRSTCFPYFFAFLFFFATLWACEFGSVVFWREDKKMGAARRAYQKVFVFACCAQAQQKKEPIAQPIAVP